MKFFDYINSINQFYLDNRVNISPFPEIVLNKEKQNRFDPFIKTGNFQPKDYKITLYIDNRQVKDILRTYCHELIHVNQYLSDSNSFLNTDTEGKLVDNKELSRLEEDAFLRGNVMFRKWTEEFTMK